MPPSLSCQDGNTVRSGEESAITICKEIHRQAWKSCNSAQSERRDQLAKSMRWENFTAD